ncbi:TD and POZ domain-containing protein 5 [Caerostris darwini]|uniref:TD and POZ domain-containing protein 5 n=1 Tax=Caerostris darwini TaxID=1538125 RepID=A0AAV4UBX2_9ARAC|nr:TD and POZ domain-containing protein 5 [Caerostris darwini]
MALPSEDERKCCTILWTIENFSYYLEKEASLESPTILLECLEKTKWSLVLWLAGILPKNLIIMNLKRNLKCTGPDNITLNVDMALLLMNGSVLHQKLSEESITFQKCQYHAINTCLLREEILDVIRNKLLPKDSLIVQCRIWRTDGETMKEETFFARTVVEIERKSFIWDIHYFSPYKNPSFILCFPSNLVVQLNLLFEKNQNLDGVKIRMRITSSDQNLKSFTFQCELLEETGKELICGRQEFWPDDLQEGRMFTLPYTRQELMENKVKYLPNGVLSLKCDCVIAMGIGYNKIEGVSSGFSPLIRHPYSVNESKPDAEENEHDTSSDLKDDLKTLYSESVLSDMKILTSTETFLAHTQILAARSPVFRAMFSTDMKERTTSPTWTAAPCDSSSCTCTQTRWRTSSAKAPRHCTPRPVSEEEHFCPQRLRHLGSRGHARGRRPKKSSTGLYSATGQ